MYIKKLKLDGFRNYDFAELEFSPLTNVIYGNNAQGKTNILEAVYLFSQGRSHRAKTDKELVNFERPAARLVIEFADSRREYVGHMQIKKTGKKSVSVNHVHIQKLSKLMNYLNVVMFSPEDLDLVKGSPSARRKFIDSSISQLYPAYLAALMEYNKALNQKNSLLKTLRSKGTKKDLSLSVWNEQLAKTGAAVMKARIDFVAHINELARNIQAEISSESLSVKYLPSVRTDDITESVLYDYFERHAAREIDMGSSICGIQRDDLEIFVNDRENRLYGSQGQQRTAALSMKIAQSDYINDVRGEYPVLLLDDIMSELDINRRMYLAERIRDKQVLITSTDTDLINKTTDTRLFRVENGKVML